MGPPHPLGDVGCCVLWGLGPTTPTAAAGGMASPCGSWGRREREKASNVFGESKRAAQMLGHLLPARPPAVPWPLGPRSRVTGPHTASSRAGAVQTRGHHLAPRLPPLSSGGRGPSWPQVPVRSSGQAGRPPAAGGEHRRSRDCEAGGGGRRGRGDALKEQEEQEGGREQRGQEARALGSC